MFARVIAINQKQPSHTHTYIQPWSRKINRFAFFFHSSKLSKRRQFVCLHTNFHFPSPFTKPIKCHRFQLHPLPKSFRYAHRKKSQMPARRRAHIFIILVSVPRRGVLPMFAPHANCYPLYGWENFPNRKTVTSRAYDGEIN